MGGYFYLDTFVSMTSIAPRNKYKLVFVGDSSVGKTSIISRFMHGHFDAHYDATIGIDFLAKTHTVDGKTVRLQLWDTAGQERVRSLIPSYIRDSSVAVVVYDVSKQDTFHNTNDWISEVRKEREEDVLIMLVGNKTDVGESQRAVRYSDGEEKARRHNALFIETSAKSGHNVKELFDMVCKKLPEGSAPSGGPRSSTTKTVKVTDQRSSSSGCGCM